MTAAEPTPAVEPTVQIDLAAFRGLVDVAHNLGRKHLDCDQYAAMHLVVRQAPALLALAAEQAATIERYDTALIEATRDHDQLAVELYDERAAVNGWITDANNGLGSDVGDLMQALEQARARGTAEPHDDGVSVSQAAMEETLAAADEDRDRLAAELDEARAETKAARVENARVVGAVELWLDNGAVTVAGTEALRALIAGDAGTETCPPLPTTEDYRVQVYELWGEWSSVGGCWPTEEDAVEDMHRRRRFQAGWPAMRVLRVRSWIERLVVVWEHPEDVTVTRVASRAPESPADATTPRATPDA